MTPQDYIQSELEKLSQPASITRPANNEQLAEEILRILTSKKFRKYSANPALINHIKQSIQLNIERGEPINITFTHGAYKLWRFEEAPEVDWAEFFSLMYYTKWLKPICEIYNPGVWFDSFVDDLILQKLDNISAQEVASYMESYRNIHQFLKGFQPTNFKMTITGVSDQFDSVQAFEAKLAGDIAKFAANFPDGLPEPTETQAKMIELNAKPNPEQRKNPDWMKNNVLMHDAYITMTKRETGYAFRPNKILAFTQPLTSGAFLAVGSTKDSIAKFWTGVGALQPRDVSFRQIILPPSQLSKASFEFQPTSIPDLTGKNFTKIRVIS